MNRRLKWIIGIVAVIVATTLLLLVCVLLLRSKIHYTFNQFTGRKQLIAWTIEEQRAIGDSVEDEIENETATSFNTQRVVGIGEKLLNNNGLTDNEFKIRFFVIKDTNEMFNAFARIGGRIYITKSLLDSLKNDDEVAFILSHEITHILGQHRAESWTKATLLEQVFTFGGESIVSLLGNKVADLTKLSFSRKQESEADFFAVQLMLKAGYNPTAALDSFDFFEGLYKQPNAFFSDHPSLSTRRKTIKKAMEAFNLNKQ
jgi:beta-barrel assembly-enhancing protease